MVVVLVDIGGQVRSEKACCCACLSFSYRIGTPY